MVCFVFVLLFVARYLSTFHPQPRTISRNSVSRYSFPGRRGSRGFVRDLNISRSQIFRRRAFEQSASDVRPLSSLGTAHFFRSFPLKLAELSIISASAVGSKSADWISANFSEILDLTLAAWVSRNSNSC